MNTTQQRTIAIIILVMGLGMSGCGPGQFLGPTVTPLPTPTSTPIPFGTLMLSLGFVDNSHSACDPEPCQNYQNMPFGMSVTHWDTGKLELRAIMLSNELDVTQLVYTMNILYSLYPQAVGDAVMERDVSTTPYYGELDGYQYDVSRLFMSNSEMGEYTVLVILITPTR